MFSSLSPRHLSLLTIFITGFASTLGQILVVRELLILFYGNELSTGLIFTSWLIWTAMGSGIGGKWITLLQDSSEKQEQRNFLFRLSPSPYTLSTVLTLFSFSLPATLLWIRASRILWHIAPGELLPLSKMFGISFSVSGPFCLLSGLLFSLSWAGYLTPDSSFSHSENKKTNPLAVYMGEAAGAALAGIIFYFILLPWVSVLSSALITSGLILLIACRVSKKSPPCMICVILIFTALFFHSPLDHLSRKWQWGEHLITVRDTPFHNLALVREKKLFTLFANGLWSFSTPDPQSAERSVHPALLQHPNPQKILLIGGGVSGMIHEILKHPSIRQVDYIEPDPELIRFIKAHLPKMEITPLHSPRVHLFHEDAGTFIRQTDHTYDVVLMNVGDPVNAQMNRFYTKEFCQEIQRHLKDPLGIFSFAVSSAPDMLGPAQIQFLRSVYETLRHIFPQVVVYPGEDARFFATGKNGTLITDPDELLTRMTDRNLRLRYVREYYLFALLSPLRLDYFNAVLTRSAERQNSEMINQNFKPTCYFYNLVLWSAQVHAGFRDVFIFLSKTDSQWLWAGLVLVIVMMIGYFHMGPPKPDKAIGLSVMVAGGTQIAIEIVILLGFQIVAGFVYTQIALIIAFFMTGLAVGSGISTWIYDFDSSILKKETLNPKPRPLRLLILIQMLLSLYLVAIVGILFLLQILIQKNNPLVSSGFIFSILAIIAGILGGSHFSLAVRTISGSKTPSAKIGGGLYALDMIGSAAGALFASLVLLPIYGLVSTLILFALLNLGSIIILNRRLKS